MPHKCVVEGCGIKLRNWLNLKFYTSPIKNLDKLTQWILALKIDHRCALAFIIFHEDYIDFTSTTRKKDLS